MIGLSILGLRKREKNRKDEVWNEWQKDTLFNDKVLEVKEQVDKAAKQVNEISKQVGELKAHGEKQDAIFNKQDKILEELVQDKKQKAEEAKRLHFEALVRKLNEILDEKLNPRIAEMKNDIAEIREEQKEIKKLIEEYDKLVTQGVKDLQGAGEGFKALRRMKEEDKEIEDETDPDVRDAMVSAQLEELRELRNKLVGDVNDNKLQNTSKDLKFKNSCELGRRIRN